MKIKTIKRINRFVMIGSVLCAITLLLLVLKGVRVLLNP